MIRPNQSATAFLLAAVLCTLPVAIRAGQPPADSSDPVRFLASATPVPGKTAWKITVQVQADQGWHAEPPDGGPQGAPLIPELVLPAGATQTGGWTGSGENSGPSRGLTGGDSIAATVEADSVGLVQQIGLKLRFQAVSGATRLAVRSVPVAIGLSAWGPELPFDNSPALRLLDRPVDNREIYRLALERGQKVVSLAGLPGFAELEGQLKTRSAPASLAVPQVARSPEKNLYESILAASLVFAEVYDCGKCDNLHVNTAGGVVISGDGLALTNCHVLEGKNPGVVGVVAMNSEGVCHPVLEILSASRENDVALVRLGGAVRDFHPAPLARSPAPPLTRVQVLSHPHREYFVLTEGRVSRYSLDHTRGRSTWMEITADFGAGSSGSGVFNEEGEIVGLVSMVVPLIRPGKTATEEHPAENPPPPRGRDSDLLELLLHRCVPLTAIRERFEE